MSEDGLPCGPLTGVRVVEFAGIGPGPVAAMLLSDMGAEVIRIEPPQHDPQILFDVTLRGRPSLAFDLKQEEDLARVIPRDDQRGNAPGPRATIVTNARGDPGAYTGTRGRRRGEVCKMAPSGQSRRSCFPACGAMNNESTTSILCGALGGRPF